MEMAEIDKQIEGGFGRLAMIYRHGCGCVWGTIDRKHLILSAENEQGNYFCRGKKPVR